MFPKNRVTGVKQGRLITALGTDLQQAGLVAAPKRPVVEASHKVNANFGGAVGAAGGASISINSFWNSQFVYWFTNLIPAEPNFADTSQLAMFYRDMYLHDSICGSVVDLQSTFPFSNYDLRGLTEKKLQIYQDALSQLNILRMMPLISTAYLVDGYFCGSLVYDEKLRMFMDTMIHDALSCQVIPSSFFNQMPTISVRSSQATMQLLNSDSPYTKEYLNNLPGNFIDLLRRGEFTLNPITTLFVARRSLTDRAYSSFLHRALPMYLIEKTLYRGTLVEITRRQRSTTHIAAGDDIWTPTTEELNALVGQFQMAEYDPLGGWVSTRNAVQINDIRQHSDFLKWTDMSDTFTGYKLRALMTSESFLSGEASYAAMESAYSTYLESMDSYRNHLTNATFESVLFPLIAVSNGIYKDDVPREQMMQRNQISKYLLHVQNRNKLDMPQLVWHKSLEAHGEDDTFDLLEKAEEHGVPVPLKSWLAAAGMSVETLTKDLAADKALRAKLAEFTGKDVSHDGDADYGNGEEVDASFRRGGLPPLSLNKIGGYKRSLLGRFEDENRGQPELYTTSRTGKKKAVLYNQTGKRRDINARLAKISARANIDPEYREALARRNEKKLGYRAMPLAGDMRMK